MATDFTLTLIDEPGALAGATEALAKAGINIEGVSGDTVAGEGKVHLLFKDGGPARAALSAAGVPISAEREVMILEVVDRPGELARVARALADSGVNIELAYLATESRLVLGVDDPVKAMEAVG
jgi:hypothetical protein